MINSPNYFDYNVHVFVTLKTIFVEVLFIRKSKYTTVAVNRHLNANGKRMKYFGVQKKDRLERVNATLKCSFRL